MSKTKEAGMAKVVLNIPYGEFVVDSKDAMALCEILGKAEKYHSRWKNDITTHHVYPVEASNSFGFRLITNEQYNMYKLAGKPED
jgi:hypothetical protein